MRFGPVAVAEAEGAILAHGLRLGRTILRKGRILTAGDVAALDEAGRDRVTVARLEPGDIVEDAAAHAVAQALAGEGVDLSEAATGRVNLLARAAGLAMFDADAVDALNAITEDVTFATLPALAPVAAGRMVATIKIIPFAVPSAALARCVAAAAPAQISVLPLRPLAATLIQTVNEGLKPSVIAKTSMVTADRLARIGGALSRECETPHAADALAAAIVRELASGCDVLLIIGASAIVDRRDVIPAAIEAAGGRIERLGMPVDPGNLILLGAVGATPVLGLPGCARSPARNGLDWVLERIAAGAPVGAAAIAAMGVGGLLIGREEEKDYR